MYKVQTYRSGRMPTNTYLLVEEKNAVVIDAAAEPFEMIDFVQKNKLNLQAILLTHTHYDHFLGIFDIWEKIDKNIPLYYHPSEKILIENAEMNGGFFHGKENSYYTGEYCPLSEGVLQVGNFSFNVWHIPGHTPGGVAFCSQNDCFCGDSLFAGTIGRSDWGYSDPDALVRNIKNKLLVLPDDTNVFPGHGCSSTIGKEKANNPYLK